MEENGGAMEVATDEEAYQMTRLLATSEGISVEPATAVTFAGLMKLARAGIIEPDEVVVANCSGHTYPVEEKVFAF
jgi:threonine synthase